ncbi:pancreatic lipase-related protein 2-like [Dermacentor silvarum]|uniref:pancreatic lipase-related protein 2-like n=1 Tax=Dermacentor silvarum TaxID=543639 RepID=UPI002100DD52|nr:pancreatic lipase-related protein 2-like [Dermacentor silvarum]
MCAYPERFVILVAVLALCLRPSLCVGSVYGTYHLATNGEAQKRLTNGRSLAMTPVMKALQASRHDPHRKEGHSRAKRFAPIQWFYEGFKSALISEAEILQRSLGSRGLCYRDLGCFKLRDRMRLPYGFPQRPQRIGARFWLYCAPEFRPRTVITKAASSSAWIHAGCQKKAHRPLVVIVHGFSESAAASWVKDMARALLKVIGANVLLVDWRRGAAAPVYSVAAANTPAVGAELSVVLQQLMQGNNDSGLVPHDVHIIGFSLGAHVAGFCGRHFLMHTGKRIGRITALDPAGPLFEGTNVSVSRGDAEFVDVIHTNMGLLDKFKLGLAASVGDVDFFPNGGSLQPGCHRLGCSHRRAHALMIESITNHHCIFVSRPVSGKGARSMRGLSLNSRSLQQNDVASRGAMGYDSITAKGRGIQYIRTRSKPPFCIP